MYLIYLVSIILKTDEGMKKSLSNFCLHTDRVIRKIFQKHNIIRCDFCNYNLK